MSSSRPSDHFDSVAPDKSIKQPKLGFVGYLRFFWRQLTSMKTALFLLLMLAFAAIPGSLVPQRTSDPNGVVLYARENPTLYPILDKLQVFDTYSSVWFSSIYLLLFVSLVGCVLPRAKHHYIALRARPPRTPARLERLTGFRSVEGRADAATALDSAHKMLKRLGYRVERFPSLSPGQPGSVSAERGYMRETGNLVFHIALVGILIAVGIGGNLGFTGQRVVVEGQKFVNTLGDYDSFNPGRFVDPDALQPYRIALDSFSAEYETENPSAIGQPLDYTATVTTTVEDGTESTEEIKVNSPLEIGGTQVYLLGNGYAPVITVKNPAGDVVWSDEVPFLPQDNLLTSSGVIKIPDGLSEQLGMIGFFYPTVTTLASGALASSYPDLNDPLLSLRVYTGDLGLDDGEPKSVYSLNTDTLTAIAGGASDTAALQLGVGDVVDLPNGLGTIEMTAVKRFASLDVHSDPSQVWVLIFAVFVLAGLLTGLFIPRRRVWVKVVDTEDGGIRIEYAGLARGEDPGLDSAVADIATKHSQQLGLKVET
jgi:cytochrome c biogenesis protein